MNLVGTLMILVSTVLRMAIIAVIAYFVVKKAVKDAIREIKEEKKQLQANARAILAQNGIDYSIKTINRKSAALALRDERMRTGTLGEKLEYEYEYIIYVKKEDYEKACFVMRQVK